MPTVYILSSKKAVKYDHGHYANRDLDRRLFAENFPIDRFEKVNGKLKLKAATEDNPIYNEFDNAKNVVRKYESRDPKTGAEIKEYAIGGASYSMGRVSVVSPKMIFEIEIDNEGYLEQIKCQFVPNNMVTGYRCFASDDYEALWKESREAKVGKVIQHGEKTGHELIPAKDVRATLHALCDKYLSKLNIGTEHDDKVREIKGMIDSKSLQEVLAKFEESRMHQLNYLISHNKLGDLAKSRFAGLAYVVRKELIKLPKEELEKVPEAKAAPVAAIRLPKNYGTTGSTSTHFQPKQHAGGVSPAGKVKPKQSTGGAGPAGKARPFAADQTPAGNAADSKKKHRK